MSTLVIAEKPSVAREIAAVVGARKREDGYIEGSGYVVSWCRGHLVDLATPDEYSQWAGPWDISKLPMVPRGEEWVWRPSTEDGAAAQYKVLAKLMERADVDEIVNACDADREGEGIFARIYNLSGCMKPVKRFWSTSLVDTAIRNDLANAKPAREYAGLAAAAEGRAKADWLVGLNATRAYVCLYGARLSAGRVQTPVVAMIAERTREAESFTVKDFFSPVAMADRGFALIGDRYETEGEAQRVCGAVAQAGSMSVKSAEYRDERSKAPALYDLTSLQRDASERFGYTADETLATMQSLYEEKLLTYPRTDSRYITSDDAESAEALLGQVAHKDIVGDTAVRAFAAADTDINRVVNDEKVAGHGAVLPTELLTAVAFKKLELKKQNICRLVCLRLLAAVMPPAVKRKVKIVAESAGEELAATSTTVRVASWIAVDNSVKRQDSEEGREADAGAIPEGIAVGDVLGVVGTDVRKGKTTPPKLYTDSTLLSAMEHAGRKIEDKALAAALNDDSSHSGGLGTPATRANIIEHVIKLGYVGRKGKSIRCTDKGFALIDTVSDSLKTPLLTAKWEAQLADIEHGEGDLSEFLEGISEYTAKLVREAKDGFDPARRTALTGEQVVGKCPQCGKPVLAKKHSYQCSSNKFAKDETTGKWTLAAGCGFSLTGSLCSKRITPAQAKSLLAGKPVVQKGMVSAKSGKTFDATLTMEPDGRINFDFETKAGKGKGSGRGKRRSK